MKRRRESGHVTRLGEHTRKVHGCSGHVHSFPRAKARGVRPFQLLIFVFHLHEVSHFLAREFLSLTRNGCKLNLREARRKREREREKETNATGSRCSCSFVGFCPDKVKPKSCAFPALLLLLVSCSLGLLMHVTRMDTAMSHACQSARRPFPRGAVCRRRDDHRALRHRSISSIGPKAEASGRPSSRVDARERASNGSFGGPAPPPPPVLTRRGLSPFSGESSPHGMTCNKAQAGIFIPMCFGR